MTQYIFNEEVIWQDKRTTGYRVFMLILTIIFALLAAAACLIPKLVYSFWLSAPAFVFNVADFLIPTGNKIIFAVLFGIPAFLCLSSFIISITARLYVTPKRLCLMKTKKNYREARFDKIDAIKVKGHRIKIYADGRKVFSFGPIANPFATRNCIAGMIELPYTEGVEDADDGAGFSAPGDFDALEPGENESFGRKEEY
ncbi:MAG TPA: hypothetical protein O0X70_00325 [Methanocorpusculum sp.]|nr:hypothetical protein [Methanocorpusculum sp.]